MLNVAKSVYALGRTVYKTKTAGAQAGTMFDAFCKTMGSSNVSKQSARQVFNETTKKAQDLENIAKEILKNSGANATVTVRVKGVDSTASKIQKKFIGFGKKGYENSRGDIHEVILGKGTGELVGDSFGFRYILQSEKTAGKDNSIRIYESILNAQKQNKKSFELTCFEDYYGKGIKPYGNEAIRDKYAELQYRTSLGKVKETIATFTEKPSGYTRTNINGKINGVNAEIQVGGIYTTKWGDIEHILYDMRQGKPLDMSKYTPEQKELALKIEKAYKEVLERKTGNTSENFNKNYLNKLWDSFRNAEANNLKEPVYPKFPEGYPEVLKIENLLKLAHD